MGVGLNLLLQECGAMRYLLIVLMLSGCNLTTKHERPRDITCSTKCTDCKDVEMQCHGISKSEDDESITVKGK
jgi:hypothetical protein